MENQSITNNLPIFHASAKLNNNNYAKWVSQIIHILEEHGLYAFIDSKCVPPSEKIESVSEDGTKIQIENPKFKNWVMQDQRILTWLVSTVTEQTMCHVIGTSSATSMSLWLALENKFGSLAMARLLDLRTQFRNTKQGTASIKDYLHRFKFAVKSLTAAGENLSNEKLLLQLLAGLRPEYEGFIISITTQTQQPTYAEVANMLRFQEKKMESLHQDHHHPVASGSSVRPAAGQQRSGGGNGLQRIPGPNPFNRPFNGFNPATTVPFSPSHKAHNHNFQRGSYQNRHDGNNLPKCGRCWQNQSCQICNVQGHSAINCRFRFCCN